MRTLLITPRAVRPVAFFALTLATVLAAGAAAAQEVCGETTCPKGYTCETYAGACLLIDCIEGEVCEPCEPVEQKACVPGPCSSDADCDAHMACAEVSTAVCPDAAPTCDADGNCSEPEHVECTATTVKQCLPRWQLPCSVAADCGEGFTCEAMESCWCAGSEGSAGGAAPESTEPAGADGSAEPPDAAMPEGCECRTTDETHCTMIETACSADTDCPAGWTCQENPNGTCWADAAGNTSCTPADPARLCTPPYSSFGSGGVDLTEGGLASDAPASNDGAAAPGVGAAEDEGAADEGGAAESSASGGGCTVSGASAPSTPALLLLGLAALLGVRRRRSA